MTTELQPPAHAPHTHEEAVACHADAGFQRWLAESGGTLAVTTYQAGKLLLAGWDGQRMSLLIRSFDRAMGLDVRGTRLALSARQTIHLFERNTTLAHHYDPERPGRYDGLYLPRLSYHVGSVNVHDVALTDDSLWAVNTRFSCLMQLSSLYSFLPVWQPSFIDELMPEDRCHLNGLAMRDDAPAYVTALSATNTPQGWREHKTGGGIVMDVATNTIIARGLTMPHSPRWYDDQLWVLNSGAGQLLKVETTTGNITVVCELQGYLRGLTFVGRHALIGLCQIRETNVFGGMPVQSRHDKLLCGIALVNIDTGAQEGLFEFTAGCTEIYDIRFVEDLQRLNILNLAGDKVHDAVTTPDFDFWLASDEKSH